MPNLKEKLSVAFNPEKVRGKRGFSLIEILIVVALLVVIIGLTLLVSFDNLRSYSFRSDRDMLVAALHKTRNQAVNNICLGVSCTNGKSHGVAFPPLVPAGEYVIFQGSDFVNRDVAMDEIFDLSPGINIAGTSEIVFSSLSGDADPPDGNITISDDNGLSSVISINSEGQITWTN